MRAFLLLASMLFVSHADDELFSVDIRSGRSYYCGRQLQRALMFVCDSIYKRSSSDMINYSPSHGWTLDMIQENPEPYEESSDDRVYPFRSRAKALSMMPFKFRRTTRQGGVADECCSKPCSIAELKTYCGPKPSYN